MLSKEKLQNDLQDAMRSGNNVKKQTIRMVLTNIKINEVNSGKEFDEAGLISVIQKEIKSRNETIDNAKIAERQDIIDDSLAEIKILETYLPEQLSEEKVKEFVAAAIAEVQAVDVKDMGKVMKIVMPKIQGKAPNALVSQIVKAALISEK